MIIAVDFDGTIVTHEFPQVGKLVPGALETIAALQKNGHHVFLWTMRGYHNDFKYCLEDAVEFCERRGITFDSINYSPGFKTSSPKQHAALYIDDSALGCPRTMYKGYPVVDWSRVGEYLVSAKAITKDQLKTIQDAIINTIQTDPN